MDIAVKSWVKDMTDIEKNHNKGRKMKRVLRGYGQPIQTHCLGMDEQLKDRDAGHLSFFMPGAELVQIEY